MVENGEVIALLDITKCLYDAIARMEKAAEKGDAIAAAVQGVQPKKPKAKKQRNFTKRTKLTNAHMPELFQNLPISK